MADSPIDESALFGVGGLVDGYVCRHGDLIDDLGDVFDRLHGFAVNLGQHHDLIPWLNIPLALELHQPVGMDHGDALIIGSFGKPTGPGDIIIEVGIGVVDHGLWHQYLTTHLDKVSLVRDHNLVALLQLNVGDDALVCDHDLAQG